MTESSYLGPHLPYIGEGSRSDFEDSLIAEHKTTIGRVVSLQELLERVGPSKVKAMGDADRNAILTDFIANPARYGTNRAAILGFTSSYINAHNERQPALSKEEPNGEIVVTPRLSQIFRALAENFGDPA